MAVPMGVLMTKGTCKGCKYYRKGDKCKAPGFVKPISPYANYSYDVSITFTSERIAGCDYWKG